MNHWSMLLTWAVSIGLCTTILGQELDSNRSIQQLRKDAHKYLISEYLNGKDCTYSDKFKNELEKVVIYDNEQLLEEDSQLNLPEGTHRVFGFFDTVIVESSTPDLIEKLSFKLKEETYPLKLKTYTTEKGIYQIPPTPEPCATDDDLVIEFLANAPVEIQKISLRAKNRMPERYSDYDQRATKFPNKMSTFQNRHFSFFKETQSRTFDELLRSLNEHSEAFSSVVFPSQLTAGVDLVEFNSVLVDRRVAKIYETLQLVDPNEAAAISAAMVEREFAIYRNQWEGNTAIPARYKYAMDASLFLCSEFCAPELVIKSIDDWNSWHQGELQGRGYQFKSDGPQDFHFTANLYTHMIIKKNDLTLEQANRWIGETLSGIMPEKTPVLQRRMFLSSDWTPNRIETIKTVPVFQSFSAFPVNQAKRTALLEILKQELEIK